MKMCNKIFAAILSIVLLLSVVPFSAFADTGAVTTPAGSGSQGGVSLTLVAPNPIGTGADGTLTFTLDPADVAAALKGEKSIEAILDLLRACVERSENDLITQDDLLEIVPTQAILTALLGENNENASALIKQFGGINALLNLVNEEKLILTASRTGLLSFLNGLDNASDVFNFGNIFSLLPAERQEALKEQFKSAITVDSSTVTEDKFKTGMYAQIVLDTLNACGKNERDYISLSDVLNDAAVKTAVSNKISNDLAALDLAGKLSYLENALTAEAFEQVQLGTLAEDALTDAHFRTAFLESVATDLWNANDATVTEAAKTYFNDEFFLEECGEALEDLLLADVEPAIITGAYDSSVYLIDSFVAELAALVFDYIETNGFTITEADINAAFGKISAGDTALSDVIDIDLLFASLTEAQYASLFSILDQNTLINELSDDIKTLAAKLNSQQIKTLTLQMLSFLSQNVDLISINGYEIAKEAESGDLAGLIAPNYEAIVGALASLVPSLEDLGKDSKLLSFNFYTEYLTANGEARVKDINVEFVLIGDLTPVRNAIEKLAEYIDISKQGNTLFVEITLPAIVTEAYAKFLESEAGAELRDTVLGLPGMTGADLTAALKDLTLDQVLALLAKADPEAIYSYVMNLSYVEAALNKINEKTGLDLDITKLQDLNTVLDAIANGTPSFEAVCNAVSAKIGTDVMKALETAATYADKSETLRSYLAKAATLPYVGRLIDSNSFAEILEQYSDVDLVKTVSDYVAKKFGTDLRQLILENDINELYAKALEKASDYESYFEKAKTIALNLLDPDYVPTGKVEKLIKKLIPDSMLEAALNKSLIDFYEGNGSFHANTGVYTLDIGAAADKAFDYLLTKVELSEQYVNMIRNLLPEGTVSLGLDLTVNFQNLALVTYEDENGNELFTTFLPNGVDPQSYQNAPEVEFKNFLHWADKTDVNGEKIDAINGDIVLRPVYSRDSYTVTFTGEGGVLLEVTVLNGMKLSDVIAALPEAPSAKELGYYNGTYLLSWTLNGATVTAEEILGAVISGDLTFTYVYTFVEGSELISVPNGTVTMENGNWTAEMKGDEINLTIDRANGDISEIKTLTAITESGAKITIDEATMKQIAEKTAADSVINLTFKTGTASSGYTTDLFVYTPASVFVLELTADGASFFNETNTAFAGTVKVELPFAGALLENGTQRTVFYLLTGNGSVEKINAVVTPGVGIAFNAAHFSEYFAVNEYMLESKFVGVSGTTNVDGQWIPAGAVINAVLPTVTNGQGKVITTIQLLETGTANVAGTIATIGGGMTMPAHPTTIQFTAEEIGANVTWRVQTSEGEKTFTTQAEADAYVAANKAKLTLARGYEVEAGKWIGVSVNGTVYMAPKTVAVKYTVTFGSTTVQFTVEDLNAFYIPAITEVEGYTVKWICKDLSNLVLDSKTKASDVISAMITKGVTTVAATAEQTAVEYTVYLPDGTVLGKFKKGDKVTVQITVAEGHKLASLKWVSASNATVNGDVTNNEFTMPASNVLIEAVIEANTVSFTVQEASGNPASYTAKFGETVTYQIKVPAGYTLESAPYGKLVSFVTEQDGSITMTYAFTVTAEFADNTKITYTVARKVPTPVKLANGLATTEEAPASAIENLVFAGFAAPDSTVFKNNAYQFATYDQVVKEASLLWLWILIALVVVIALITILYRLYINGKMKPNFFLRFITWIVSCFFSVCLALSGLFLLLTQGTTKKEDVDFEMYGLKNPEEEKKDEAVTETLEDKAPEAAEKTEAAEEAEATEEVTEEAEEVAEEAEATDEVALTEETEATEEATEEKKDDQAE